MLEFREWATAHYKLNLIVKINEEARGRGVGYETHDPVTVTHGVENGRASAGDGAINGTRSSPASGATKIRPALRSVISRGAMRNLNGTTRISRRNSGGNSPPPRRTASTSACNRCWIGPRCDIWRYIQRENIPIPKMYFARNGQRYRSLGCRPITKPITSNADTIEAVIAELETTRTSERAGRAQGPP